MKKYEKLLCPSMMCADHGRLAQEVRELEEAGADIFHIDFMDGVFVPNIAMGLGDIEFISRVASIPLDLHLMVKNPEIYYGYLSKTKPSIVYFHPETTYHPIRFLSKLREDGVHPAIAVTPHMSASDLKSLLPYCDYVMVMTVNPGFAGQKYLLGSDEKLAEFASLKEKFGYKLMIDGACSPERIATLNPLGVDGFVLGTSALFNKNESYKEIIKNLRGEN